jgi:hypothetical protein
MRISQCDVCKRQIGETERPGAVRIARDGKWFALCTLCADPIVSILAGYELLSADITY